MKRGCFGMGVEEIDLGTFVVIVCGSVVMWM